MSVTFMQNILYAYRKSVAQSRRTSGFVPRRESYPMYIDAKMTGQVDTA